MPKLKVYEWKGTTKLAGFGYELVAEYELEYLSSIEILSVGNLASKLPLLKHCLINSISADKTGVSLYVEDGGE